MIPAGWVNRAWAWSARPAWTRMRDAVGDPERAQSLRLRRILRENASCRWGLDHRFSGIDGWDRFRRLPLTTWSDYEPWIDRIRSGETGLLTRERVTRLVPTGGGRTGSKLVPWTRSLAREFRLGIGAWIVDLFRRSPGAADGKAYWSVSPARSFDARSVVPIGFDADTRYLGGALGPIVAGALAVPESVARISDVDAFLRETLLHLVRSRDLTLVSVWHPSFFTLLLDRLARDRREIVDSLRRSGAVDRAAELEASDPARPASLWPKLAVVSAWADAHAAEPFVALARRLPGVSCEPKGLVSTEAFVTLPFEGRFPAAVTGHVLEFAEDSGAVRSAHELRDGGEYAVVVTTGGGLYRYRSGDRVRVEGFLGRTPSLRFLGRDDRTSDRAGEKLSDAQVAEAFRSLFETLPERPTFAMLAPDGRSDAPAYALLVELDDPPRDLGARLDRMLSVNPAYAWARDLGQLGPIRVVRTRPGAHVAYLEALASEGRRLGAIKSVALSDDDRWAERLARPGGSP